MVRPGTEGISYSYFLDKGMRVNNGTKEAEKQLPCIMYRKEQAESKPFQIGQIM